MGRVPAGHVNTGMETCSVYKHKGPRFGDRLMKSKTPGNSQGRFSKCNQLCISAPKTVNKIFQLAQKPRKTFVDFHYDQ